MRYVDLDTRNSVAERVRREMAAIDREFAPAAQGEGYAWAWIGIVLCLGVALLVVLSMIGTNA